MFQTCITLASSHKIPWQNQLHHFIHMFISKDVFLHQALPKQLSKLCYRVAAAASQSLMALLDSSVGSTWSLWMFLVKLQGDHDRWLVTKSQHHVVFRDLSLLISWEGCMDQAINFLRVTWLQSWWLDGLCPYHPYLYIYIYTYIYICIAYIYMYKHTYTYKLIYYDSMIDTLHNPIPISIYLSNLI